MCTAFCFIAKLHIHRFKWFLLMHKFTYLSQYKCMSDRDVIPCTRSHRLNDHHLQLIVICCHPSPIAHAVTSNLKKLKHFDFMLTQPQRNKKRTTWCFLRFSAFDELQCSRTRCIQWLFATRLRPIGMKLFCAPCSSAASEKVFSQLGLIMRPTRSRLFPSTLTKLVFVKCNKNLTSWSNLNS